MNMLFLIISALVVLLIIIVIVILLKGDKKKPKNNVSKVDQNINVSISNIEFPKNIEQMSYSSLSQIVKGLFDTYKALDYANKPGNALEKQEWHSWQVSILLVFLKIYQNFFIGHEKNIFHSSILNLDNEQMKKLLAAPGEFPPIEVVVLGRIEYGGEPISASRVRKLMHENRLEEIIPLVPQMTYALIEKMMSKEEEK